MLTEATSFKSGSPHLEITSSFVIPSVIESLPQYIAASVFVGSRSTTSHITLKKGRHSIKHTAITPALSIQLRRPAFKGEIDLHPSSSGGAGDNMDSRTEARTFNAGRLIGSPPGPRLGADKKQAGSTARYSSAGVCSGRINSRDKISICPRQFSNGPQGRMMNLVAPATM